MHWVILTRPVVSESMLQALLWKDDAEIHWRRYFGRVGGGVGKMLMIDALNVKAQQ